MIQKVCHTVHATCMLRDGPLQSIHCLFVSHVPWLCPCDPVAWWTNLHCVYSQELSSRISIGVGQNRTLLIVFALSKVLGLGSTGYCKVGKSGHGSVWAPGATAAPPEQLLCSFFWQQRPPRPPPRRCGRGGRCENRNEGPCWPSQFTCICAPAVRCNIVSAQEGPRSS